MCGFFDANEMFEIVIRSCAITSLIDTLKLASLVILLTVTADSKTEPVLIFLFLLLRFANNETLTQIRRHKERETETPPPPALGRSPRAARLGPPAPARLGPLRAASAICLLLLMRLLKRLSSLPTHDAHPRIGMLEPTSLSK